MEVHVQLLIKLFIKVEIISVSVRDKYLFADTHKCLRLLTCAYMVLSGF